MAKRKAKKIIRKFQEEYHKKKLEYMDKGEKVIWLGK